MEKDIFEFRGSGLSCFWLLIWTSLLTFITFGLFFPWAHCAYHRWEKENTYINNRQLQFNGNGIEFLGHWIVILLLCLITLGIYTPWAVCQIKRWEIKNTDFVDKLEVSTSVTAPTTV